MNEQPRKNQRHKPFSEPRREITIETAFLFDENLTAIERNVYAVIAAHAINHVAYLSPPIIADLVQRHHRNVRDYLTSLVKKGYLERTLGNYRCTYRLLK